MADAIPRCEDCRHWDVTTCHTLTSDAEAVIAPYTDEDESHDHSEHAPEYAVCRLLSDMDRAAVALYVTEVSRHDDCTEAPEVFTAPDFGCVEFEHQKSL